MIIFSVRKECSSKLQETKTRFVSIFKCLVHFFNIIYKVVYVLTPLESYCAEHLCWLTLPSWEIGCGSDST